MGKFLKVDQFFLLQLDQWPCPDCEVQWGLRLKGRLVDASSGDILWTGIIERVMYEEEAERAEELALEMAQELTQSFFFRFRPKWHYERYQGLKRLRDAS